MKPINKPFQYRNAEETRKPGYLAKRFADIRKQQKAQSELPTAKVIDLTPGNLLLRKVTK